jgi:hypothetical protein
MSEKIQSDLTLETDNRLFTSRAASPTMIIKIPWHVPNDHKGFASETITRGSASFENAARST